MKKFPYVSHRARGFAAAEQSGEAFRSAFSAGITRIEFDIRITREGIPVVHHDSSLKRVFSKQEKIADKNLKDIQTAAGITGNLNNLPAFHEVLNLLHQYKKYDYLLFIDIKDSGAETVILETAERYNLLNNIIIVSWLPQVLFEIHRLNSNIPLCFSHHFLPSEISRFLFRSGLKTRAALGLAPYRYSDFFLLTDKYNNTAFGKSKGRQAGKDFEHILTSPPQGKLGDILLKTGGYVCMHYSMIDEGSYRLYSDGGFRIIPYSINTPEQQTALPQEAEFPFVLTDNPKFALEPANEKSFFVIP